MNVVRSILSSALSGKSGELPALTRAKEAHAQNAERLYQMVSIRLRNCREGENFWSRLTPGFQRCFADFEASQNRLRIIAKMAGREREVETLIQPIPEQVRPEGLKEILKEAKNIFTAR